MNETSETAVETHGTPGNLHIRTPGLIQVWYSSATLDAVQAIIELLAPSKVACLSCPSVFYHVSETMRQRHGMVNFEFDRRWETDDGFCFYDCYQPTDLPGAMTGQFDLLIADPPAINLKTLQCYAASIKLLSAANASVLFSTIESNEHDMLELLTLSPQRFRPDLPEFALDGRWCFYANFACDVLRNPNPVADARRAAAEAEEDPEAEGYGAGYTEVQHEL